MDVEEDAKELLGSVVQKKRNWRLEKAWEMSVLHWENSKGGEALNSAWWFEVAPQLKD